MVKNDIFKSQLSYFISILVIIYVCLYGQSLFLSRLSSAWFHIDFVSIVMVYMCLEHGILLVTALAFIVGFLLQTFSSSLDMFFVLYFVLIVLMSNIISSFFVINSTFSRGLVFVFLFVFKYILFFFVLTNKTQIGFMPLIETYWKEFFSTCVMSIICYKLLAKFDYLFILPGTLKSGKSYAG